MDNNSRNNKNQNIKTNTNNYDRRDRNGADKRNSQKKFHLSLPVILFIIILIFVVLFASVVYKFQFGGVTLSYDPDYEPEISLDAEDIVLYPLSEDTAGREDDGVTTILCIGNDVFSDDRDDDTSLSNLIASEIGATVYNVSFPDTTISLSIPSSDSSDSNADTFSFYSIANAIGSGDYSAQDAISSSMGDDYVKGMEVLEGVDFDTIDTICIMYDASDYVKGRTLYNPSDATSSGTGVTTEEGHDFDEYTYMGAFIAGVQSIHEAYPHIRIVMNSFTYCQGFDEDGVQTDGDTLNLGNGTLTDYYGRLILACESQNVTFLDDYNGFISSSNYTEYLEDNIHLNVNARQYVAHHFNYIVYPELISQD